MPPAHSSASHTQHSGITNHRLGSLEEEARACLSPLHIAICSYLFSKAGPRQEQGWRQMVLSPWRQAGKCTLLKVRMVNTAEPTVLEEFSPSHTVR